MTRNSAIMFSAPLLCLFWLTMYAVDSAQLSAPVIVWAAQEGSVTLSCQYENQLRKYSKCWCKGPVYGLCTEMVRTPGKLENDRSSIADNKEAGVFTLTMTSLRESDQDMYWCVIYRRRGNVYTGVSLIISNQVITTTAITTAQILHDEICWWMTLRWIVFTLMLCCLVSTHVAVWWMKTPRKIWRHQQVPHENANNGVAH